MSERTLGTAEEEFEIASGYLVKWRRAEEKLERIASAIKYTDEKNKRLLQRVEELEKHLDESGDWYGQMEIERLKAENQLLREKLEKKEQLIAEIQRGE